MHAGDRGRGNNKLRTPLPLSQAWVFKLCLEASCERSLDGDAQEEQLVSACGRCECVISGFCGSVW